MFGAGGFDDRGRGFDDSFSCISELRFSACSPKVDHTSFRDNAQKKIV